MGTLFKGILFRVWRDPWVAKQTSQFILLAEPTPGKKSMSLKNSIVNILDEYIYDTILLLLYMICTLIIYTHGTEKSLVF